MSGKARFRAIFLSTQYLRLLEHLVCGRMVQFDSLVHNLNGSWGGHSIASGVGTSRVELPSQNPIVRMPVHPSTLAGNISSRILDTYPFKGSAMLQDTDKVHRCIQSATTIDADTDVDDITPRRPKGCATSRHERAS